MESGITRNAVILLLLFGPHVVRGSFADHYSRWSETAEKESKEEFTLPNRQLDLVPGVFYIFVLLSQF